MLKRLVSVWAILLNQHRLQALLTQQQQQQQHSLFSQASWGRLEMKPERKICDSLFSQALLTHFN